MLSIKPDIRPISDSELCRRHAARAMQEDKRTMTKSRHSALALVLSITAVICLTAGAVAAERPGMISLDLPIGPRAVGMGGAFASIADDATAMYWNPAGIARLTVADKHFNIMFQHNEWIADFRQEYVGGATRIGKHGFGGSFSGFYVGDIDGRDEYGQPTPSFGAYDVAVTGSYSYSLSPRLAVGASGKYLVANIDDLTRFAFALDLGAQFEVRPDLWVGGAVTNLGKGVTFVREQDELPTAVQGGVSYLLPQRLGNGTLLLAADVRQTRGDDAHLLVGGEYDYAGAVQFQAGYRGGYDNDDLSFGVGTLVSGWELQYAVVPFSSDLGTTHRVAVGFQL